MDTIYVNSNANGDNSGSSWVNAFTYFGDALKAAKYGDEVWVAKGTYSPKDSTPFEILKSIKLFGGFIGNETSVLQRDWKNNETILERGTSVGLLYRRNVLYINNTDSSAILDGFIIQKGYAYIMIPDLPGPNDTLSCINNPYKFRACEGGGIFMHSSSKEDPVFLKIFNCAFRNNYAIAGGAIGIDSYSGSGGVYINNCEFYNNKSSEESPCIYMFLGSDNFFGTEIHNSNFHDNNGFYSIGAIHIISYDLNNSILIENSNFLRNDGYQTHCGALWIDVQKPQGVLIKNCLFKDNYCGKTSSNIYNKSLGGSCIATNTSFINCRFTNNKAWKGGAVYGTSNTFLNCIFDHNYADNIGGAIYNNGYGNPYTNNIVNCTFFKNNSKNIGGAIFNLYNQKLNLYNSIFTENKAKSSANNIFSDSYTEINVSNLMVDEPNLDSVVVIYDNLSNEQVNIDTASIILAAPIFWDTLKGDFRISNCSKAIDAGNFNLANNFGLSLDYTNGPRVKNKNIDLGAFEMDKFLKFDTLITNSSNSNSKDGEIKLLNFKGFKPPLDFTWSNSKKDSTISNLNSGNYIVYIEDSLNCSEIYYLKVDAISSLKEIKYISNIIIKPNIVSVKSKGPILELISEQNQVLKICVFDNLGNILKKENWFVSFGMNSKDLPNTYPGIYFVVIENLNKDNITLKYTIN